MTAIISFEDVEIFEFRSRGNDVINIKICFVEFDNFGELIISDIRYIDCQKRGGVHFVRLV